MQPKAISTARVLGEGLGYGVAAGVIFGAAEMVISASMGVSPVVPLRMFASVVTGQGALTADTVAILAVGVVTHLALSALFGLIFAVLVAGLFRGSIGRLGAQAALGLAYGALLYAVDFQVIARIAYPWFLDVPQLQALIKHALFFGLPLGLMLGITERAVRPAAPPEPKPHPA